MASTSHQLLIVSLLLVSSFISITLADGLQAAQPDKATAADKPVEHSPQVAAEPKQDSTVLLEPKLSVGDEKPSSEDVNKADQEASKRKGRAESAPSTDKTSEPKQATSEKAASSSEKSTTKVPSTDSKSTASKAAKPTQSSTKSSSKSKLPPNLGTVTSTGSGGYLSKHDAYSAIAEKHGALAADAMKKSDKHRVHGGFGGIQKASGFGDILSPFKGVTDSGLARTLGASMRSIIKGKYTVPAYVASALLGAVALMAFYESPISPLPVPALPEPPVGRFPPEMPNISPNVRVPFRTNQQQQQQQSGYNQRSYQATQPGFLNQQASQMQPQVLFPGNNVAQQRQMNLGPVQLASELLSAAKQPAAQRKSAPDYDQSVSRSLFGPNNNWSSKLASPSTQKQQAGSFLSFFGLGGSASGSQPADSQPISSAGGASLNSMQASNLQPVAVGVSESKGQNGNVPSNSFLVNKFKSFFSRSSANSHSPGSAITNANPADQYQRLSFIQALMKDAAFLPGFLSSPTPSRKASVSSSAPANKQTATGPTQNVNPAQPLNPNSRMQVSGSDNKQLTASTRQKSPASGYGLVKAADRIAHALLETFTSGVAQRNAVSGQSSEGSARKSSDDVASSPISSATSLISELMTLGAANLASSEQSHEKSAVSNQPQQQQYQAANSPQGEQHSADSVNSQSNGRSSDSSAVNEEQHVAEQKQSATKTSPAKQQTQASPAATQSETAAVPSQQTLVRKTRSIGMDYPLDSNQELAMRERQASKAAQINNMVDFVADSYSQNRLLFNFVMNQVGLSQAVPYIEQILGPVNH